MTPFSRICLPLLAGVFVAGLPAGAASGRPPLKNRETLPQAEQPKKKRGFKIGGHSRLNFEVKVLLTGDSLMYALGPQLKKNLAGYEGLTLIPIGKSSSGLSRPDFYDWPEVLEKHFIEDKPDVVVMWIGTNDSVKIYGKEHISPPCSKEWNRAYAGKMLEIINLARKYNVRLVWMGPPVMDRPTFDGHLKNINQVMHTMATKWKCHFVDTRSILADKNGVYMHAATMPDGTVEQLRTGDHIHITEAGNRLVMERLLPVLSKACEEAVVPQPAPVKPRGPVTISSKRPASTVSAVGQRRRRAGEH